MARDVSLLFPGKDAPNMGSSVLGIQYLSNLNLSSFLSRANHIWHLPAALQSLRIIIGYINGFTNFWGAVIS